MNDDEDVFKNMGAAAYGFFKAFLKEQKENVGKFFVKNQVGFIPEGMDYSAYQSFKKKSVYKQLKFLIGNHPTLPIVVVGLWLNSLPEKEQVQQAKDKRNEIYGEYKEKGVNILNMAVTGFMEAFVKWLSNYNIKRNLAQEELIDLYEKNLGEWSEITIFVQESHSQEVVLQKCKTKMAQDCRFIYIFASYGAIPIAEGAVLILKEEDLFKQSNYQVYTENLNREGTRQVWIIEKQESVG